MADFNSISEFAEMLDKDDQYRTNLGKSYEDESNSDTGSNPLKREEDSDDEDESSKSGPYKEGNRRSKALNGGGEYKAMSYSGRVYDRNEGAQSTSHITLSPEEVQKKEFEHYLIGIKQNEQYHSNLLNHMRIQNNEALNNFIFTTMESLSNKFISSKFESPLSSTNKQPGESFKLSSGSDFRSAKPNGASSGIEPKSLESSLLLNSTYLSQMPKFFSPMYDQIIKKVPSKDTSISYIQQIHLLSVANNTIFQQIQNLLVEKEQLNDKVSNFGANARRMHDDARTAFDKKESLTPQSSSSFDKKKRHRRNATEIERHYRCPCPPCSKSYGSEGSLNQHIKLKHRGHVYTSSESQKFAIMGEAIMKEGSVTSESEEKKKEKVSVHSGIPIA